VLLGNLLVLFNRLLEYYRGAVVSVNTKTGTKVLVGKEQGAAHG
jgi:hypothetical protein